MELMAKVRGLQLVTDDIGHIESQNRGLQVQTSNQRALLSELDKLMVRSRSFSEETRIC